MVEDPTALALRALVMTAHRILTGTIPDHERLAGDVGAIQANPSDAAELLRRLAATPDAERMHLTALLSRIARTSIAQRGPSLRRIVGLGTLAYTAALLKATGPVRVFSPFDPIFSSPNMVADCLNDDFARLLDQRAYEPIALDRRAAPEINLCDHAYYRDQFHIPSVFNRFDPTVAREYSDYERSVRSFHKVVTGEPTLLVLITSGSEHWERLYDGVSAAVRAYASQATLLYVVAESGSGHAVPHTRVVRDEGGHVLAHFIATSAMYPLEFANPIDDIAMLGLVLSFI